jgi:hypothetical protein
MDQHVRNEPNKCFMHSGLHGSLLVTSDATERISQSYVTADGAN